MAGITHQHTRVMPHETLSGGAQSLKWWTGWIYTTPSCQNSNPCQVKVKRVHRWSRYAAQAVSKVMSKLPPYLLKMVVIQWDERNRKKEHGGHMIHAKMCAFAWTWLKPEQMLHICVASRTSAFESWGGRQDNNMRSIRKSFMQSTGLKACDRTPRSTGLSSCQ